MSRFPSEEWIHAVAATFNAVPDMTEADRRWDGGVYIVVTPEGAITEPVYMYLYIRRGVCVEACLTPDLTTKPAAIIMSAPISIWRRIFDRKLHMMVALVRHKIKLEGNLPNLLRYITQASPKKWRTTFTTVPTEFPE